MKNLKTKPRDGNINKKLMFHSPEPSQGELFGGEWKNEVVTLHW